MQIHHVAKRHVAINRQIHTIQVMQVAIVVVGHVIHVILKIQHEMHVFLILVQHREDALQKVIIDHVHHIVLVYRLHVAHMLGHLRVSVIEHGVVHRIVIHHVERQNHVQHREDVVQQVIDERVRLIVPILLVHVVHTREHQLVMIEHGVVLHIVIQVVALLQLNINYRDMLITGQHFQLVHLDIVVYI